MRSKPKALARAREYGWEKRGIKGMTVEKYDAMLKSQKGKCALCGNPPKKIRLSVDHNHKTGNIRGLLCYRCNRYVLGRLTLIQCKAMVDYLEKYDG